MLARPVYLIPVLALAAAGCDVSVGDKGVSVGLSQGKATDQWVRTYTLDAGGRLEIINVNGPIAVSGADGSAIEVRVDREARGRSDEAAKAALAGIEIREEARSDYVKVEVRRPRDESFSLRQRPVSVSYTVRLPQGTTASFRTENGAIQIDRVSGNITAATMNGGVSGRALSGSISASTVNGGVQLSLDAVSGAVVLTAVNGPIRLELASDVKADLMATAVNGTVSVDEQLHVTSEDGGGAEGGVGRASRLTGRMNGGGPAITAQTTNGGVRIAAQGSRPGRAPRR